MDLEDRCWLKAIASGELEQLEVELGAWGVGEEVEASSWRKGRGLMTTHGQGGRP